MGKGIEKVGRFLRVLKVNPVIPAVRGRDGDLERALAGDHAAIFVLGGDVFRMLERVRRRPYRRPFICVNVDMVGGVASDASGIGFLAREVDGVISTHRKAVEILPGLAFPEIVESYRAALNKPVLAGGLIKDRPTAAAILEAGAVGIST